MSAIVEVVGRAMASAEDEDYMEDYRRYDRLARVALLALREPTETMVRACHKDAADRIEALEDALRLILPMARGYAARNDVGSNREYVEQTEGLIK